MSDTLESVLLWYMQVLLLVSDLTMVRLGRYCLEVRLKIDHNILCKVFKIVRLHTERFSMFL